MTKKISKSVNYYACDICDNEYRLKYQAEGCEKVHAEAKARAEKQAACNHVFKYDQYGGYGPQPFTVERECTLCKLEDHVSLSDDVPQEKLEEMFNFLKSVERYK